MALKLPDSAVPMGDFPVAKAVDIDFYDGENLQDKFDNGELGGAVDLSGYVKTFTSLDALGLTAPVSVGEIFNAMPNKTMAVIACEGKEGNTEGSDVVVTDIPFSFGVLTIKKNEKSRFSIDYQNSLQGSSCNVKRWIGTLKGLDGTGLYWKQLSTEPTYITLSDMGLTSSATIQDAMDAVPVGSTALLRTDAFTNWSTLFNGIQYGYFKVEKTVNGLCNIELQEVIGDARRYFGTQSSGKFYKWKQLSTEPTFITLNDIGLTSDVTFQDVIDALPKGASAILGVKDFKNYQTIFPYEEGNDQFARVHIVKGLGDGSCVYARWFRKDGTKEAIAKFNINDNKFNGWQKIATQKDLDELFQSVSNGKTLVANAITGKGVSTATNATFATMATNIGKISGGYKEETKSLIVTSGTTGTEVLPFTFSANVIAVKKIVAPSDSCRIVPQTSKDMLTINGKELVLYVAGTGTWKVTALIES